MIALVNRVRLGCVPANAGDFGEHRDGRNGKLVCVICIYVLGGPMSFGCPS